LSDQITIDGKAVTFNADGSVAIASGVPFVGNITIPAADMARMTAEWTRRNRAYPPATPDDKQQVSKSG